MIVKNVSTQDVLGFMKDLRDEGATEKTLYDVLRVVVAVFNFGIYTGLLTSNPFILHRYVKPKPLKVQREAFPEKAQVQLLSNLPNLYWFAFVTMALSTGMREAELLGLEWRYVDLQSGLVKVRQQLTRHKTLKARLKTRSSRADLILSEVALTALRGLKTAAKGNLVFSQPGKGEPWSIRGFYDAWKRVLERAGVVGDFPPHAARHSANSNYLRWGVPRHIVAAYLRWDESGVQAGYTHLDPGDERKCSEAFDAWAQSCLPNCLPRESEAIA
jgi:integrase